MEYKEIQKKIIMLLIWNVVGSSDHFPPKETAAMYSGAGTLRKEKNPTKQTNQNKNAVNTYKVHN